MATRARSLLPLLLLAVLPAVWWYPLLTGQLPNFMDTITHGYPLRMAVASQVRSGTLPLWMPNTFSGTPLAANPQLAVWYPPHLLFYAVPGAFTFGVLCVLHYMWGGWGAYFYVRRISRSVPAAIFAAVTFQFSAMLVSRVALLPHVYTTVWVPWMLLAVERAVREPGFLPRRGALFLALLFAMQLLAGSPQITYYTGLLLPPYWLLRTGYTARWQWRLLPGRLAQTLCQGALAALIALMLSGIQILPTLEFLRESERSPINLDRLRGQALTGEFIWRSFVGFTGPTIEDTDSINAIGLGAILLAMLALFPRSTRRYAVPLWVVGIFGFLLALGPLTDMWSKAVPLFSSFHAPRRALVFWTIAGSLAAGAGAAYLHGIWRARRLHPVGLYATLAVLTGGTWWMLPRLEREFVPTSHLEAIPTHTNILHDARYLVLDPTFAYAYDSRRADYGTAMLPNLSALHNTFDANGYDPLVPARYGRARNLACARSGVLFPSHGVFLTDPNSPLFDMLNVQYLVGRHDLFDPGRLIPGTRVDHTQLSTSLELIRPHERWPVFRYKQSRPLAWAVEQALTVESAPKALEAALAVRNFAKVAFVEEFIAERVEKAEVTARRPDARTFAVSLPAPPQKAAFVCIASTWMPGWRAFSDGQPMETLPANGLITGVVVPPGVSEFTLQYQPLSFLRGASLSVAGLLILLAGFYFTRRSRVSRAAS